MQTVYYPHAIYVPGICTITQIGDQMEVGHNFQDLTEFSASQVGPQFTGSHMAAPDNRFSTTQIKSVLDACTEYNISRDLSGTTASVQYKAGKNLNHRMADDNGGAGGNHLFGNMQENAMLAWESISARQDGTAEIRCRIGAVYKVSTGADPLVFTSTNDITVASDVAHLFTLGPAKLNGSFIEGVEEADVENNIEYEEASGDGDNFLTYLGIRRYRPVFTFRTRNSSYLTTYGTRGTALSSFSFWLRKKLASAINVADATEEHILFTATVGTIKARAIRSARAVAEVTVEVRQSAQNTAAYAIDTTAAIA